MKTVADVRAVPHLRGGRIDLTWTLPPSTDFEVGRRLGEVKVVRRERTFPRNESDGNVVYEGGGPVNLQGQVAPNGSVWVSVSAGGQRADGEGRMSPTVGTGTWRGQGAGGSCAGESRQEGSRGEEGRRQEGQAGKSRSRQESQAG